MIDPISAFTEQAGDVVWLLNPVEAGAYNPGSTAAFTPPTKGKPGQRFRGTIADKKTRENLPAEASTAFTISTTSLPKGLQSSGSYLLWKGITYLIVSYRQREYRGQINGYTLFLKA